MKFGPFGKMSIRRKDCEEILSKVFQSNDVKIVEYHVKTDDEKLIIKVNGKVMLDNVKSNFKFKIIQNSWKQKRDYIWELFGKFRREFPLFSKTLMCEFPWNNDYNVLVENYGNGEYQQCEEFDVIHLRLVLKHLAKLHAGSLIYQRKTPIDFPEKFNCDFNDKTRHIFGESSKFELKVVSHGNVQTENLQFRYENGFPLECKLQNFHHFNYTPLGEDVIYFLYKTTDLSTRQKYFLDLIEFYHSNLAIELNKANLHLADVINPNEFQTLIHSSLMKTKITLSLTNDIQIPPTELLLTIEDCFQIVKSKMATVDYEFKSFDLKPLKEIAGYLGDHKRLQIKLKIGKEMKTLKLFAKFSPQNRMQKQMTDGSRAMIKEAFIYKTLFPMMKKFGIDLIHECTIPIWFNRPNDVIVFDDLSVLNYKSANAREPLSRVGLELALNSIAQLHASSIILEEKMTFYTKKPYRINEQYAKELPESFFSHESQAAADTMRAGIAATLYEIDKFAKNPEVLKKKSKIAYEKMYEEVKPSREFRNVICHGDLWASNLMFRHQEDAIIDCKLIDFQIIRYVPPAHDLLCLLFLNTNREIRAKHFDYLIDFYYKTFATYLRLYGCDVEKIYTRSHFIESCKALKLYAVAQTVLYYHSITINPQLMKEIVETEKNTRDFFFDKREEYLQYLYEKDPLYVEKARESILDLEETCDEYL